MGNAPSKSPNADGYLDYGAICPDSPSSFEERDMFEDIIAEPLVASDRKPSMKSRRKSWDSVHSRDSKRISLDSAFDAAKDALDKMMPRSKSYNKIGGRPKELIGVEW
ncbi:hypothetical protein M406DRAFT_325704 [Cryphonectria parasitica EP155]|uniref:Uncharacterized protein n=1 Tax=Cryphonectria parasitica (strain ATCC 38755 / EP155) TaxID=660469 RepID=A0A9P5CT38_CRYP1|nr:uncharacterized protein M406DRAFT_325704 [Cryphonectria parasitica EP155]KAF3770254.1 hypothetical protein M406DRAFT_325704 [Cryphonectria parasitica EP155]